MKISSDSEINLITGCMNRINEIIHEWDDVKPRTAISYKNCKCSLVEGVDSPTEATENTGVSALMNQLVMDDIQYHNSRSKIIEKIHNKVKSVGKEVLGEDVNVSLGIYEDELQIYVASKTRYIPPIELFDFIGELRINFHDIRLDFEKDMIVLKVKYPEVNQVDD